MLDEKLSLFVEVDFKQKFCDAIEKSINLSLNTYYIAYMGTVSIKKIK